MFCELAYKIIERDYRLYELEKELEGARVYLSDAKYRAEKIDICKELETRISKLLEEVVSIIDDVRKLT